MTPAAAVAVSMQTVIIPAGVMLSGDLTIPANARGIVVFVHGSGSGRFSPRNQRVARHLQSGGFATLLFDLLTADEEALDARTAQFRFDIPMLTDRLLKVTDWLAVLKATCTMGVGYLGASTGAAAALIAAAARTDTVRAVVASGGRPDLAGAALDRVRAPTLLIVGGADLPVIEMNQYALMQLGTPTKRLEIVRGATHLFEELGMLERVSDLALQWFGQHLGAAEEAVGTSAI